MTERRIAQPGGCQHPNILIFVALLLLLTALWG